MTIKANNDYSPAEFETMGDCLRLIIKRAENGLQYGKDIPASRAVILLQIQELTAWETWHKGGH